MSRILTYPASTQAALTTGAKPRLILRIDFGGAIGTKYYAEEALTTPVTAEGRMMNAGELNLVLSGQGLHAVSDIEITLSDSDLVLRGYLDQTPWALKRATLYQHFVANAEADLIPLLVGYVDSSPQWHEADATVTFDLTDAMTGCNVTIGHVAAKTDFSTISLDNEGLPLPLVFGRVKDLKCVQVTHGLKGSLLGDLVYGNATCIVEGGEDFPQGTSITVRMNGEFITGTMAGKVLTISARNAAIYTGTTSTNTSGNIHAAYDNAATIRDNIFSNLWLDLGTGYRATRIAKYYGAGGKFELLSPVLLDGSLAPYLVVAGKSYSVRGLYWAPTVHFAGSTVEYVEGSPTVYYIANDTASLAVHKVKALKKYEVFVSSGGSGKSEEHLVDVPEDYYSVNLRDTTTFAALGRCVTTIALAQPLTQIPGESWASDEIWVEISGYTRGDGALVQNPADVIKYLLQDFGAIPAASIDSASFAAAAASTAYRNFAFALREQRQMNEVLADLAFQTQCQLMVMGGILYLFYLGDQPSTSQKTFTTATIDADSITRAWRALDEVQTELTATYAPDLSERREAKDNRFTLRDSAAESVFGRRVGTELNLWAYRDASMAKAVAQYYLNNHSRTWGKMTFRGYLDALALLPMDWVTVGSLVGLASGQKGRVDGLRHAPGSGQDERPDKVEFEVFLPVYPGCTGTCEVACEKGGCEGGAQHGCSSSCEVSCTTTCEVSCQEACELLGCVTKCEQGCTVDCQQNCQTTFEKTGCDTGSCESTCQENCQGADCQTGNEGAVCDSNATETGPCTWDCMTVANQTSCSMYACQGVGTETTPCGGCETTCQIDCQVACEPFYEAGCDIHCESFCQGSGCESGSETAGADYGFLVFATPTVMRGVTFNITIQSYRITTGAIDTAFVPAGDVTIEKLNATDAADLLSPAYTSASGWSNGAKTVTCEVTTGSGYDTMRIVVTDPNSGRTGYCEIAIDPVSTQTLSCAEQLTYAGSDSDHDPGTDESDASASGRFISIQNDALANLNADSSLENCNSFPYNAVASWGATDTYNYISFSSYMSAGHCKFVGLNNADAIGLVLKLKAVAIKRLTTYGAFAFADAADAGAMTLHVLMSENASFATAATLRGNTAHFTASFAKINAMQAAAGGTAAAPALISIPLVSSAIQTFLAGLSSGTVYAWVWVTGSAVPYRAEYQNQGGDGYGQTPPLYGSVGFAAYVLRQTANATLDVLYST